MEPRKLSPFGSTELQLSGIFLRFAGTADGERSGFETEGELFDDGVGENLASNALYLELGRSGVRCERVFEGEEEVLALTDIGDAIQAHATERSGDGLALGIEDGAFQCDISMRLHEI